MSLNNIMQFDHVIEVRTDGTVIDAAADIYAPNLCDDTLEGDGWTLLDGHSGQYGYSGPMMHASEFIGGGLADRILSEPGIYVALVNYNSDDEDPEGWAVARKN